MGTWHPTYYKRSHLSLFVGQLISVLFIVVHRIQDAGQLPPRGRRESSLTNEDNKGRKAQQKGKSTIQRPVINYDSHNASITFFFFFKQEHQLRTLPLTDDRVTGVPFSLIGTWPWKFSFALNINMTFAIERECTVSNINKQR